MFSKVIIEQFNDFKKQNGKYENLQIEDIIFKKTILDSIVNFINGKGGYTKKYYTSNPGTIPLWTGALEIKSRVKAIDENHVIKEEGVSYNKDNDSGSKIFYHDNPYIAGAHHYAILIKKESKGNILPKYLYYAMTNVFPNNSVTFLRPLNS